MKKPRYLNISLKLHKIYFDNYAIMWKFPLHYLLIISTRQNVPLLSLFLSRVLVQDFYVMGVVLIVIYYVFISRR